MWVIGRFDRVAVPIEMALEMRARQVKVIAITSLAHSHRSVLVEAAAIASKRALRVRVLRSANMKAGDREPEASIAPYVNRIPALVQTTCS